MSQEFAESPSLVATMWARKRLTFAVVAAAVAGALAYTLWAPAIWEAKTTIIFPVRQPSALGLPSSISSGSLSLALGGPTPVRVFSGILESTRTLDFVGEKTGKSREELRDMTSVVDQQMQNTITISAHSTDADLARKIVSVHLDALRQINTDLNVPLSQNDTQVLKDKIDEEQSLISGLEQKLLAFQKSAQTAPTVASAGHGGDGPIVPAMTQWVGELRELEVRYSSVESGIDAINAWSSKLAKKGTDLPSNVAETEKWREALTELEYELRTGELTYGPSAPEIRDLKDKIDVTKKQLASELGKYSQATHEGLLDPTMDPANKLPGLLAQRVELEAQIRAVRKLAKVAPSEGIELSRIMRDLATHTGILQQLEGQYQLASVQEAQDPNRWDVLDAPYVEDKPLNKSFSRNIALGLVIGLCLALALATTLGPVRPRKGSATENENLGGERKRAA